MPALCIPSQPIVHNKISTRIADFSSCTSDNSNTHTKRNSNCCSFTLHRRHSVKYNTAGKLSNTMIWFEYNSTTMLHPSQPQTPFLRCQASRIIPNPQHCARKIVKQSEDSRPTLPQLYQETKLYVHGYHYAQLQSGLCSVFLCNINDSKPNAKCPSQ